MTEETKRKLKVVLAMFAMLVIGFYCGIEMGSPRLTLEIQDEPNQEQPAEEEEIQDEMDKDSFMAGMLLASDYIVAEGLHDADMIQEEDYKKLMEVLDEYLSHPTKENQEKWQEGYWNAIGAVSESLKPEIPNDKKNNNTF